MGASVPSKAKRTGLLFEFIFEGKSVEGIRDVIGGVIIRSVALSPSMVYNSEVFSIFGLVDISSSDVERGRCVFSEGSFKVTVERLPGLFDEGAFEVRECKVSAPVKGARVPWVDLSSVGGLLVDLGLIVGKVDSLFSPAGEVGLFCVVVLLCMQELSKVALTKF